MIVPAATFRLLGFYDEKNQKINPEPQEGNVAIAVSDTGNLVALKFKSNKSELSFDDFLLYIQNKEAQLIKQKDVDKLAGEIEYLEDFDAMLEAEIERYKKENPEADRRAIIDLKKNFKNQKALSMLRERKKIGKDTIIRVAISTPSKGKITEHLSFSGRKVPVIESRSIIFNQDGTPSSSGFYIISQHENVFPVEISPIFKQDGTALGLFKIFTAKHISLSQLKFLLEHIRRTIKNQQSKGTNPFFSSFEIDKSASIDSSLRNALYTMNKIARNKNVTYQEINSYFSFLDIFEKQVISHPELITKIQTSLGIMFDTKNISIFSSKDNPFVSFPRNAVNLNFSSQNPDIKQRVEKSFEDGIGSFFRGEKDVKLISTYFIMATALGEEESSWGYMHNNFQLEKSLLFSRNSFKFIGRELNNVSA